MSAVSGEISLQELLAKFNLYHIYSTLTEQEFDSLEILNECSEDDVSSLCHTLNLSLLDKLRFKRALKSVHIPQDVSRYTIINKQEQNYIVAMDDAIKRMEQMIVDPNDNQNSNSAKEQLTKRHQLNENVIHSSFDMLVGKLNQKKDELLAQLKQIYEDRDDGTQQMITHLNSAKSIKKQCHQLLLKDTKLNEIESRTNTIKTLNDQCLSTEKAVINLKNTMCNVKNICIKIQNDEDVLQFINHFATISNDEQEDGNHIDTNLMYKAKQEPLARHNVNNIASDTLDTQQDNKLFAHNPVRAWRWCQITNKWIRRGRGTISLHYNEAQHLSKLLFVDDESNSTTLLQYVDKHMTKLKCVKEGCVSWESYDYSLNPTCPQKGLWILKFISNPNAASEFLEILNDQTEMLSNKNTQRNQFKIPCITHSKSAHSEVDLQKTIAIKKLYCFGKDKDGNCCWKIRASRTEIEFVQSRNHKIKLVAKQREDEAFAMNHYIPVQNANLVLKQDLVYQWNTFDASLTTWSARFYTNADAESFRVYFNKSVHCNLMTEMKLNQNLNTHHLEIEQEGKAINIVNDILQLDNASTSVPPPQKENASDDFNICAAPKHHKAPQLTTGKSWDSADANSCSVLMVKPWSRYVTENDNNQLEIISDQKQMEQDIEIQNDLHLICEVPIRSLHRWCMELQCWQLRTAKASVLFYDNKRLNRVRLVCRVKEDTYGDNQCAEAWDFKLNHWMPSSETANIKHVDKQFLWNANDGCVDNEQFSTFAAKFFNVDDSIRFQQQFLNYFQYH